MKKNAEKNLNDLIKGLLGICVVFGLLACGQKTQQTADVEKKSLDIPTSNASHEVKPGAIFQVIEPKEISLALEQSQKVSVILLVPDHKNCQLKITADTPIRLKAAVDLTVYSETRQYTVETELLANQAGRFYLHLQLTCATADEQSSQNIALPVSVGTTSSSANQMNPEAKTSVNKSLSAAADAANERVIEMPAQETIEHSKQSKK